MTSIKISRNVSSVFKWRANRKWIDGPLLCSLNCQRLISRSEKQTLRQPVAQRGKLVRRLKGNRNDGRTKTKAEVAGSARSPLRMPLPEAGILMMEPSCRRTDTSIHPPQRGIWSEVVMVNDRERKKGEVGRGGPPSLLLLKVSTICSRSLIHLLVGRSSRRTRRASSPSMLQYTALEH